MWNVHINSVFQCFPQILITQIQIWRSMGSQSMYYLLLLQKLWALNQRILTAQPTSILRSHNGELINCMDTLEYLYLLFWLFTFTFNINHASAMKNFSTANTEPLDGSFSTLLCVILLHSTGYAGYFSQNIDWFFPPWCTLCRSTANEHTFFE